MRRSSALCYATQDYFSQNSRWRNPLILLPVISGRDGDDELKCWNDEKPLTSFALRHPHAFEPPDRPTFWLAERDIKHEPLIAIAADFVGADDRRNATRHPIGGDDSKFARLAPVQHHPADLSKITYRHTRSRRRKWLAIVASRSFGRTHAQRIKQIFASEFIQRFARTLRDHAREQSGCAAAIGPVRAGRADDAPLQNIAIAIRCIVHRGFTVARIGIEQTALVPVGAHRHCQHMLNGEPVTAILVGEIGILRKSREERCFRWRHFPLLQRDPIQQTDDALRARAEIMYRLRLKFNMANIANPTSLVLPLKIAF